MQTPSSSGVFTFSGAWTSRHRAAAAIEVPSPRLGGARRAAAPGGLGGRLGGRRGRGPHRLRARARGAALDAPGDLLEGRALTRCSPGAAGGSVRPARGRGGLSPSGLLGVAHGGAQAHRRRRSMAPGAGARDRTKTPTARRDRRGGLVVSCDRRRPARSPPGRRLVVGRGRDLLRSGTSSRDLHRAAPAQPARPAPSSRHRKPSSSPVAAPRGQARASAPGDHENRSQRRTEREARGRPVRQCTALVRVMRARGGGHSAHPTKEGTAQRRTATTQALHFLSVGSPPVVAEGVRRGRAGAREGEEARAWGPGAGGRTRRSGRISAREGCGHVSSGDKVTTGSAGSRGPDPRTDGGGGTGGPSGAL